MSDRYQIKETLGRGGMGAVYHAWDTVMKRDVALKRLLPIEDTNLNQTADESLKREAAALARFQHPNIVTIYAFEEDEDGPYVVMELVDGEDLKETVKRGALALEDFIELAEQTLDPLIAAGQLNLLHRDIKPANIMLNFLPTGKFQAKILDFGLAKFSEKPQAQTLDQKGFFLGSIEYLTPEQLYCQPLDQRTDLYSLGCVLYFCLAQESPFQGDNPADTTERHIKHLCTRITEIRDDVPAPIGDWLMRMISRHPDDRPIDAQEALKEFQAAREGKSPLRKAKSKPSVVVISDQKPEGDGAPADGPGSSPVRIVEEEEDIPVAKLAEPEPDPDTSSTAPRMVLVGESMDLDSRRRSPLAGVTGQVSPAAPTGQIPPARPQSMAKPMILTVAGICAGIVLIVVLINALGGGGSGNSSGKGGTKSAQADPDKGKASPKVESPKFYPKPKQKFPPMPSAQFKDPSKVTLPETADPGGPPPVTEGLFAHFRAGSGLYLPDYRSPARPGERIAGWANLAPGAHEASDLVAHLEDFEVTGVPGHVVAAGSPFAEAGVKDGTPLVEFEGSSFLRMPERKRLEAIEPADSISFAIALRAKNQNGHFLRLDADKKGGFLQAKPWKDMLEVHLYHVEGGTKKLQLKVPEGTFVVMTYVLDGPGKKHQAWAVGAGGKRFDLPAEAVDFKPVKLHHYQLGIYHKHRTDVAPPPFFNGHIAELLLFTKALSEADRENLEKHLVQRYLR